MAKVTGEGLTVEQIADVLEAAHITDPVSAYCAEIIASPAHQAWKARWDQKRFGVERKCDCRSRSAECHRDGWHLVDSWDDMGAALADARQLAPHGTYRVVDRRDGRTR